MLTRMEQTDGDGRTPLFYAVAKDDANRVRTLLEAGANVNVRDKNGETPLHLAAKDFRLAAAAMLLAYGAKVDAQDNQGNTPLFRAVFESRGRGEMIQQLLSAGADKTLVNRYGMSPEMAAHSITNYDVARHFK
jgi:ankyrin repeat protein